MFQDWHTLIQKNGRNLPDKVFVDSLDQEKRITYREMAEACNRVANFLRARGIRKEDRVSLIGKNAIETLILYFGVLNYGAIVNPLFFEESEENIYRILAMVQPKLVIYDSDLRLDRHRYQPASWFRFSDHVTGKPGGEDEFFSLLQGHETTFSNPMGGREDIAEIIYTSGTTSIPKGVAITREALFYMVEEPAERVRLTEEDRILEYRAYSWASAQLLSVLSTMMFGATLLLARKFSRTRFPAWLKNYHITISSGVPAVFNMLVNEPVPLHRNEVPFLKCITSSSAPLSVETQTKFEARYGIPINQMMGMSEAGWMTGNTPEERRLGSVGLPVKHKEIYFLNERGTRCGPREAGEMVVRGRSMGLGYMHEDGTVERFPEKGFHTGDLGYMDEDGYVFITGRKKDIIIRGGINISPMEITARIMEHPAVQEAETLGVPDSIYGEEVACFVVVKEGCPIDTEAIINHCKKSLPDFKIPKHLFIVPHMPKTQRGKIAKSDLMRLFQQQNGKVGRR